VRDWTKVTITHEYKVANAPADYIRIIDLGWPWRAITHYGMPIV